MCGICGIINFNNNKLVDEVSIREMMQKMKHRGPDDEGIFIEGNVGFGFVRLSILDLSPLGHQPMFDETNKYMIIHNGEVYNFIEIREDLRKKGYKFKSNTDTEVILYAYIEWGEECLMKFNGMWAFVIYDVVNKKVFASRDRYGIKPFYYYETEDCFSFASEIPALLSLLPNKPTPNYQIILDFLIFNRTDHTRNTFFKEIKKLQHGERLKIRQNSVSIEEWYNLRKRVLETEGFDSAKDYRNLLSDSIKLRLRSDVPVGVCLSGGLDSSSIVSLLLKDYNKQDLNSFSAIYNEGQIGNELEYINEYKKLLKNMFFVNPNARTLIGDLNKFIQAHGEPIPDTSPYAQFKVMELASKNVVVTLDGQGADEQLAGYHYFFGFYFKELFLSLKCSKLTNEIYKYLFNHHSLYGIKSFLYFLLPHEVRTKVRVNENGCLSKKFVKKYKEKTIIAGTIYGSRSLYDSLLDHFEYKLEHLLKWEDRNSMYFSLESRVPFLDYRLVEKTLASSMDLKIKDGMTKHILREALRGVLPEKIRLRRDKMGFGTPQDEWFRESGLQSIINEILNSESFKNREIINIQKAKKLYSNHLSYKVNAAKEIWKWIHLELWFREFID
jgi:asparagine synthase (glutamine-hydrolysing)